MSDTGPASRLVAARRHVLLAFDGPVCAAFAGYGAADMSRHIALEMSMGGTDLPSGLATGPDPFELLHFAAATGDPDLLADVDAELHRLEARAARLEPPAPGVEAVIRALVAAGHSLTVVGNNSARAVRGYTRHHRLDQLIDGVTGREDPDPSLLMPNPHLLLEAMTARAGTPADTVMVAGSVAEINAAHSAELTVVALAADPATRTVLASAHPTALIGDIVDLLPG